MTDVTKELEITLDSAIEAAFESFIEEYEMDTSASIEDMLYEFFAEGFVMAFDAEEGEEEDE
jgi:hypothetical protein